MIGLGIYHPSLHSEVAPLARIIRSYEYDFLFTIGGRLHDIRFGVPVKHWTDDDDFLAYVERQGFALVGLETPEKATRSLAGFDHPQDVLYLLGSDNGTLPAYLLRNCDTVLSIETPDERPLPIGVVAGIVAHDRYVRTLGRVSSASAGVVS